MTSQSLAAPPDTPPGVEAVLGALCAALPVEVHETHISWVFLAGDSAYKLKKPLVLPFVDYGTHERRRQMCHEEVRLNRRLAPSIYRGVVAVVPSENGFRFEHADHPEAVEHVVWMRRFREQHTLASRVVGGEVESADVEAVAALLAEFHAGATVLGGVDPCESVRAAADETFAELGVLCPPGLLPLVDAGRRFTKSFLHNHGTEMRARARSGRVVDGHGDLRAEHVLVEDGAVEVVDCVEFDPALRGIDAGADLSFLLMDLERLGAADIARELLSAYVAHGGDPGDADLVAFHAAQRAWVRAKVALVRARQLGESSSAEAQDLLELAQRLSWRARQPLLLLVCGLSASGKSTLAREIGRVSGVEVLSADLVRKRMAGVAPTDHARSEHYTAATGAPMPSSAGSRTGSCVATPAWRSSTPPSATRPTERHSRQRSDGASGPRRGSWSASRRLRCARSGRRRASANMPTRRTPRPRSSRRSISTR